MLYEKKQSCINPDNTWKEKFGYRGIFNVDTTPWQL